MNLRFPMSRLRLYIMPYILLHHAIYIIWCERHAYFICCSCIYAGADLYERFSCI